jgi:glyoxylase-like metal-dependent hydrolase (beta-lactamase superfamily II)
MKGLLTFATSLLLLLAAAGPANAQFIPGIEFIEIEKFGDGLYAFRYGPYRNIFMITAEGVIVTDPLDVKAAKILRAEIAKMTDQPVKYVAYSHSHWDHAAGGQIFKDEGAKFVAQEKCLANMRETPHPDVVLPDLTFADSYEVELGEHSLGLYYFGPSHDDCMVVMIARPANMMFIVDIGSAPTGWVMEYNPTMSDTHLYNMVPYLKDAEALARREGVTTIVSGHLSLGFDDDGKMQAGSSTGPISAISEKRQFWEAIYAAVRTEMVTGTLVEDVPDKLLASSEFKSEFLDRLGPNGYEKDEMWILLRRVGSYITSGR